MSERRWTRAGAWGILGVIGLAAIILVTAGSVWAAPQPIGSAAAPRPEALQQDKVPTETCLACHQNPNLTKKLYDGTLLSLYVNSNDHANSVHGQEKLACVDCHTNFDAKHNENPVQYPGFQANDRRDATLKLYPLCFACHQDQAEKAQDSVHAAQQAAGNRNAAVCVDCHTAHTVRRLVDPATKTLYLDSRIWIPQTCAQCHSTIYAEYRDSVHGSALIDQNNSDVPTCINCHGVHNIGDPRTAAFRLKSPNICATCHTDPKIMDKYGISTQVLSTYVSDFHGTTITLFQKEHPDAEVNKPVCFDCHGVHNIARVDDPQKGLQVRENILKRCQVCHPSATANFSDAWMSHYIPSPTKYPVGYFVDQFYKLFIPGVLGGMAVLVLLDVSWQVRKRIKRKPPTKPADGAQPTEGIDFEAQESSREVKHD